MCSVIIDAFSPTSILEIKNMLLKELKIPLENNQPIIILCIGTDRTTGDSLGPLVGYKLSSSKNKKIFIYGSLESPIHSINICTILDKIKTNFSNPFIIAIDSALGTVQNIGKIVIDDKPLNPGLALKKSLPKVGDLCIKGIVNISGNMEFMILQNTRLYTVMTIADTISSGIKSFLSSI